MIDDLSRQFFLDVMQSGHVFVRERGAPRRNGALPAFSTDTREQAEQIIVYFCRLARDGSGLYQLNDGDLRDLDDLNRTADLFRRHYETVQARRAAEAEQP